MGTYRSYFNTMASEFTSAFTGGQSTNETKKVETVPVNQQICSGCLESIKEGDGFYIDSLFEYYHPNCFRCCQCKGRFSKSNPYIPFEGKAYCERDYLKLGTLCHDCKAPIKGKALLALGKKWHQEHFKCIVCKLPIKGGFFEMNGQVYCERDYPINSTKCQICHHNIGNLPYVSGHTGQIHTSCLKCSSSRCNASPSTTKFYTLDSYLFCEYHFHYERRTLCPSCDTGIDGYCAEIDEHTKFHRECWTCAECNGFLEGYYYIHMGGAYCEKDIKKLLGEKKSSKLTRRLTLLSNTRSSYQMQMKVYLSTLK